MMYSYQQQQQPQYQTSSAVSTPQQTWNGSQWVSSSNNAATTTSSYQAHWQPQPQQQKPVAPPASNTSSIPSNPVATYTAWYHRYTKQVAAWKLVEQQAGAGTPRAAAAAQTHRWLQYQADQSSRAAHHYHQHAQQQQPPPPPFELPVAPSAEHDAPQQQNTQQPPPPPQQSAWKSHPPPPPQQQHPAPASAAQPSNSDDQNTPNSLKQFVDRCLATVQSQSDRDKMMQHVQVQISHALQAGTLHSKDWSRQPVPQLYEIRQQQQAQQHQAAGNQNNNNSSYYGPPSGGGGPPPTSTFQQQQQQQPGGAGGFPNHQQYNHHVQQQQGGFPNHHHQQLQNNNSKPMWGNDPRRGGAEQRNDSNTFSQQQPSGNGDSYYGPQSSSPLNGDSSQHPQHKKLKTHHFNISSTSNHTTSKKNNKKQKKTNNSNPLNGSNHNNNSNSDYYGPASTSNEEPQAEFLALPPYSKNNSKSNHFSQSSINSKHHQNHKYQRKDSGFNQSTLTMQDRAKRFSGPGGIADAFHSNSNSSGGGFGLDDKYMGKRVIGGDSTVLSEQDYEHMTVKGKNLCLEKEYLRLTAPPRPEMVRPQHILEQHVENLLALRKQQQQQKGDDTNSNGSSKYRDYTWFCSQFKAVRQDCTVQRIQNAFAVKVYESHARIALEEGDLNEYNQCQTQLKELYPLLLKQHSKKKKSTSNHDDADDKDPVPNRIEFLAYRLIYYVFLTGNEKYSGGSSDLFQMILTLTDAERAAPPIAHALAVRQAVADVNYHAFFRLQSNCPLPGSLSLMSYICPTIRHQALLRMCRAYRPTTLSVEFVLRELGFLATSTTSSTSSESDESLSAKTEFGRKWLLSCACVLTEDGTAIDTKATTAVRESDLEMKKSLI